ncbi:pre-16S rRNA-processing nuclease YqgF [Geitlerinema sp. PCC 7407]|uniref:pre-16S rRNA-processing nuclease YqgF n=1 Tax=Geitlerinema sp. PCC 7407 TaxID=1173025 RepID=UPI00029FA41D|nr:pre-16S rRNA-processing nuclease YqgF [Geitlerinema sp. PCC 7407]AFY67090.1 Resolvase RNase H domain protein fold protein [Geitlerinema sp. PCC 7407]
MVIVGFDPGRQKCGVAVMGRDRTLHDHQIVASEAAIAHLEGLRQRYAIELVVMGDQTTSKEWRKRLEAELQPAVPVVRVDERYSTLEARDRYWQMYPPKGLGRWMPRSLRSIPRPIDDIVAILLIERYLAQGLS